MAKQITGTQSQSIDLKAGQPQTIKIVKGQQVRIQELINGQMKDAGKVMSSRKGKDLQVKFVDGTEIVFQNFYEECLNGACSVTVGDSQVGSFKITAEAPLGDQLPDGSQLVHYAVTDSSVLMDMTAGAGEFIKTQLAAKDALPVLLQGSSVAEAAVVTSGNGWLWGLPLLGLMGGGGSGPARPDGYQGVIWDTPVSKAIVFRDLNGDGVWDANEPITITDEKGQYTGLNGVGDIVATSLDRLLWRATVSYVETEEVTDKGVTKLVDVTKTLSLVFEGAHFDAAAGLDAEAILALIEEQALVLGDSRYNSQEDLDLLERIVNNGADGENEPLEGEEGYITGFKLAPLTVSGQVFDANGDLVAIDIGANLTHESDPDGNLPSGDDFVWSGTYVIGTSLQQGSVSVHVTAVSTLVKAYGGSAGEALNAIKAGMDFDLASGTGTAGSNINVLTGELNAQLTRLMGEVIARAQAQGFASDERTVIDVINATLDALAEAIKDGDIDRIDLTNPDHLLAIFDGPDGLVLNDEYEAQALALQLGAAGPATYSVWHTETNSGDIDSNVSSDSGANLDTDQVVGNITMLARDDYSGVSLDVSGDENDSAFLQSSRIRLQAVGEDSGAGLSIYSAEGAITDLDVLATGDGSIASAMVVEHGSGDLSITGDVLVRADGDDSLGEDALAYAVVGGENVELGTDDRGSNLTVAADGDDSYAGLGMYLVSGHVDDVTAQAGGYSADAEMSVDVAHNSTLTVDNITVSASGESADASADLRGDSDYDSNNWEPTDVVAGTLEIEGDVRVTASGLSSDANLYVNDNVGTDFGSTEFKGGDITVEASGTDADAGAEIRQASGTLGEVSVEATGVPQVRGFDFLNYFGPEGEDEAVRGMDISVTIDETQAFSVSLDSVSNELVNNLPALLAHIVTELNGQLEGENFHFAADYDGSSDFKQGLFVVWDNIKDNDIPVSFMVDSQNVNGYGFNQFGTDNSNADLLLVTDDSGLTISSVHVHAESYQGDATADISGYVTVTGPISVIASEENAEASADINSDYVDPTVLGRNGQGASLTVTASGYESSADLVVGNASGTVGVVTVTASNEDAEAYLGMDAQAPGLTVASMVVTASGYNGSADADLDGPITVKGSITVTASAEDAEAYASVNLHGEDLTTLGAGNTVGDLTVSAEAEDSSADLDIANAQGTVGVVTIDASGYDSSADLQLDTHGVNGVTMSSLTATATSEDATANADIDGNVAIRGNIILDASAESADADIHINDSGSGRTTLGNGVNGSDITLTSSALSADTHLDIDNVTGAVGQIEVSATGESSDADLDLEVAQDATLTLNSITLSGNAYDADASIELRGATSTDDPAWTQPTQEAGTIVVKGNISVTAAEEDSDVSLDINSYSDDFGVTELDGGQLDVVASATDTTATARIHNASGSLADVNVSATGQPEVIGFDFLSFFADPSEQYQITTGRSFSIAVEGETFEFDFDGVSDEVLANREDLLAEMVAQFNEDATDGEFGFRFASTYDGPQSFADGLFVIWDGIRNESPSYSIDFNNGDNVINIGDSEELSDLEGYFYQQDATENSNASLDLVTDENGLTIDALSVVADAQESSAYADMNGVLTVTGDISVTASELSADAHAHINNEFNDLTTLGGVNGPAIDLTLVASGESSEVHLEIGNASGLVGDISLTASGESSDANFSLEITDEGVSAASLTVTSNGFDAFACADIRGVIDISGNITVLADNDSADAAAYINYYGDAQTSLGAGSVGSVLRVEATGESAEASLDISNATGVVGAMTVIASGESSDANFSLDITDEGVSAASLTVTAGSDDAFACADIKGVIDISGNITVSANDYSAEAHAYINYYGDAQTSLGAGSVGSVLRVEATGESAEASLDINNATGVVGTMTVIASGDSSDAFLDLETTGGGVTATSLTVTASGEDAYAKGDIAGHVSITGDIQVTARDAADYAYGYVNNGDEGNTQLGSGSVGSNLTTTASSASGRAVQEIGMASGLVGAMTVTASASNADAWFYLDTTGENGVAAGSLTVTASSEDATATTHITGQISIAGDILVEATDSDAYAMADINVNGDALTVLGTENAGSNIDVIASGFESSADLHIANAQGVVADILVSASGEGKLVDWVNTDDLYLNGTSFTLILDGVELTTPVSDWGTMFEALKAQALALELPVNNIDYGFQPKNRLLRIEWSDPTAAHTISFKDDETPITLASLGDEGQAYAFDAQTAIGMSADLNLNLDGVITGNIEVSAINDASDAYAKIDGDVAIRGDVTVTASGQSAYAEADINSADVMPASLHLDNEEPIESVFGRTVEGEVVGSNLSVTAADSSYAGMNIGYASGSVNAVTVAAQDEGSYASLNLVTSEAGITIASVSVDVSGEDSIAATIMFGDVSINGDISVESSGEDTLAYGMINPIFGVPGAVAYGTSTLGQTVDGESVGSNINVSATGEYFDVGTEDVVHAAFVSQNTRGHVGELGVSSTGISSDALALIGVKADETLTFDSLSVTANSLNSDASSATVYLYGQDGQAEDQDRWTEQQDFVTDHGTVEITGDITVTASGVNDAAYVHVNSGESLDLGSAPIGLDSTNRGYTVLGGGNITVSANATNASADLVIKNAEGSIGDIAVTAGGVPEVLGFDFLGYFDHLDGVEIENEDVITFYANGVTLTHEFDFANRTIPETPTADFINELLSEVIASLNAQAAEEGLAVHFADTFDGASDYDLETGLFAIWDTIRPGDSGSFAYNSSLMSTFSRDGSINTDAEFDLETENDGVTISNIAVVASGEDSNVDFDIEGAGVQITGDISVIASEIDADAEADINDDEGDDIDGPTRLGTDTEGSNITVTASAYNADADLDIEKAYGLVGDIAVTSGADLSETDLELWSNADGLVAASLTVVAEGYSAETDVEIDADAIFTITGDVQITAEGESADADVDLYGSTSAAHFIIQGDISATAISEEAGAHIEIVEEEDDYSTRGSGQVTLGTDSVGTNITVTTDGLNAQAHVHIFSAAGNVDAIEIEGSGVDAWAHLELEAGADRDLSIESLTVTSITGSGSSAEAEIWTANDAATIALKGDVVVSAQGIETSASVDINNKSTDGLDLYPTHSDGIITFGDVVNGQSVGSDITVIATATDSSAELNVYNAVGAMDEIIVSASGVSEVQGFDFLAYFDPEEGTEIENEDVFMFSVNDVTLSHEFVVPNHTIPQSPTAEFIRGLLDDVIESFNAQAEEEGLGIRFVPTFTDGETTTTGLFAVWDSIRPENTGSFFFEGPLTDSQYLFDERNGSSSSDVNFYMETEQTGVTIGSIAVTAEAESADAEFDIEGAGVHITGDISVVASEISADAEADINDAEGDDIDGPTRLGNGTVGSNITVTASAYDADADLDIEKAYGLVGAIAVTASADSADADLELWSNADDLEVGSLTVLAEGEDASADVELDADGDLTITGNIVMTAEGLNTSADVELHAKTAEGHLFVEGDISVTAISEDAYALLEIIDEVDVVEIDGESVDVREEGQTTLGRTNEGSNITVVANGDDSEAHVHIFTAGGNVDAIYVESSGVDAYSHVKLEAGADRDLSIDSLTIRSITGESSEAEIELWTAADSANIYLKGDVVLTAEGELTEAYLEINDRDDGVDINDTFNEGTITFGEEVNGQTVGSNITVTASAAGSSADADIHNARGTLGNVTVTSSGGRDPEVHEINERSLHQEIRLTVANGSGDANAEIDRLILELDGVDLTYDPTDLFSVDTDWAADACAAWQLEADEALGANKVVIELLEGQILVRWFDNENHDEPVFRVIGQDANDVAIDESIYPSTIIDDGTVYEVISEGPAEALLDMDSFDGVIDGDITVSATQWESSADFNLNGELEMRGALTVTASGTDAEAYASLNYGEGETVFGRTVGINTTGSNITVTASGDGANADADIYNARGTVGNVTVASSGDGSLGFAGTAIDLGMVWGYATGPLSGGPADVLFLSFDGTELSMGTLSEIMASPEAVIESLDTQLRAENLGQAYVDPSYMAGFYIIWNDAARATDPIYILNSSGNSVTFTEQDIGIPVDQTFYSGDTVSSTASLDLQLNGVIDGDIDVSASGLASDAYANIEGELEMRADVIITASAASANACADINRYDEFVPTVLVPSPPVADFVHSEFVDSNVTVAATGESAYADLNIGYASGTMNALDVSATGVSSNVYTEITVESDDTLTIDTITVTANTVGGDSATADVSIYGQPGSLAQDPEFEELENPVPAGTVRITGDIEVQALGVGDEVDLSINYGEDGYTVLAGGDISVNANATDAWADLHMENVSGQAGDLTVTASGTSEVHGFDFASYFARTLPNNLANFERRFTPAGGDVFMFTLGDQTLSYEVEAADALNNTTVNTLLGKVVAQFNIDAAALGLGVTFETSHDSAAGELEFGLFTVWNSVRDEQVAPVISVLRSGDQSADEIASDGKDNESFFWGLDGTIDSYTHLDITMEEGKSLTVQDITVTNSAENTYSEDGTYSDDVGAYTNIFGDTRVEGNVTVTASELFSYAELTINSNEGYDDVSDDFIGDTTFVGSNITVTASGQIANANAFFDNGLGTVNNITVTASGDHKMFEIDDGEDYGCYDTLCEMELVNSAADLQLHLNGAITGGVQVLATNLAAQASATITGLEDDLDTVLVKATAQDAVAQASISFDDGVIDSVTLNAEHHRSTALIDIDQADPYTITQPRSSTSVPANAGTVTVEGEGHVGITYYVDAYSSTAKTIDLTAMNQTQDLDEGWVGDWGYLDLDLVAKLNNGQAQSQQTNFVTDLLPKMIHIDGFNVQRDSINLRRDINYDNIDHDSVDVVFSSDTVDTVAWGVVVEEDLELSSAYQQQLMALLNDAVEFFDSRDTDADDYTIGYFHREITFKLGSDSGNTPTVTRSFMVYDHDLESAGASGIISFGDTTGLTERNVAHRYTIDNDYYSNDAYDGTDTFDLYGYHAIDSLSVTGYGEDTYVSYDLSDDADVMIGDIHVQAVGSYDSNGVDVGLDISADGNNDGDYSSLQLRQSNIHVEANGYQDTAMLDIDGAWGTIASINVEAMNGAVAGAYIGGEDNFDSDDTYYDHGIFVRDVRVMAGGEDGGEDSLASLDLTVNGFVETLQLEVLGESSDVFAYIDQAEYGGQVFVSGSNLLDVNDADYCADEIGDNNVNLIYGYATAQKITIDNTGRDADSYDDIEFNLLLGAGNDNDQDLFDAADVWATRLTIEGWTENDNIVFDDAGDGNDDNFQSYTGVELSEASFNILLGNALSAFNRGDSDVEYYFGKLGDNGYLFYDADNDGVTGVVEFVGVTSFDYNWIDYGNIA